MPRTRRNRTVPADPAAVWAIVGNPHNLARWWPRVERVEQVTAGQFTEVLRSDRGRTIRADHRLTTLVEPEQIGWEQELEGTPFARVMTYGSTSVTLSPGKAGGTKVQLERRQEMRGMARFGGGFMLKRATGRLLNEALTELAAQLDGA
jgi:carbon monoxide dehydrogenase subunit G